MYVLCVCVYAHAHTLHVGYSNVSPGVGTRHLESLEEIQMYCSDGIHIYHVVYEVHMCIYMLGYRYFVFLSFFLRFRRPNLITGLCGWQTPDQPLGTQEPVPDRGTRVLPSLWQTQSDPIQVGKTDYNVGGLVCILGLTKTNN